MIKPVQNTKSRMLLTPVSRATDFTSDYTSLRNAKFAEINVLVGAAADSSFELKLKQAKDVAGLSAKELAFSTRDAYQNADTGFTPDDNEDKWTVSTVANSGTTSAQIAGAAQTWYKIVVRNDMLDANNNFDCVAIALTSISGANLLAAFITLHGYAYKGQPEDVRQMPSAAVNSESTVS